MLWCARQRDTSEYIPLRASQFDCIDKSLCQLSPAQVGKTTSWSSVTAELAAMVLPSPTNTRLIGTGTTELTYSIEDVLNDEMIQDGDTIAVPPSGHLKSVFFSEDGVPNAPIYIEI